MPSNSQMRVFLFACLSMLLLSACSKGYDQDSGVYEDNGISVNFPSGWTKTTQVPYSTVTVMKEGTDTNVSLFIQNMPDNMTLDEYLSNVSANQSRIGARETSSGTITMGGLEGQWSIRALNASGVNFTSITYTVLQDGKAYTILGVARTDDFGQWETVFDTTAKSIQFE